MLQGTKTVQGLPSSCPYVPMSNQHRLCQSALSSVWSDISWHPLRGSVTDVRLTAATRSPQVPEFLERAARSRKEDITVWIRSGLQCRQAALGRSLNALVFTFGFYLPQQSFYFLQGRCYYWKKCHHLCNYCKYYCKKKKSSRQYYMQVWDFQGKRATHYHLLPHVVKLNLVQVSPTSAQSFV